MRVQAGAYGLKSSLAGAATSVPACTPAAGEEEQVIKTAWQHIHGMATHTRYGNTYTAWQHTHGTELYCHLAALS